MRLIDADALKELVYEQDDLDYQQVVDWDDIENAPTIDAVPVVHAHITGTGYNLRCPHCGAKMGAKMKGEKQ